MMIYKKNDSGNGIIDVTYNSNQFVFNGNSSKGHISTPENDVVYRGNIHIENGNWENTYINLINYYSTSNPVKIMIKDMKILSDDFIDIEKESIRITSVPIGTRIQIVEFTDYLSEFDTNSVEIERIIDSCNPIVINLPQDCSGKEYVIWVGSMCKKVSF